MATLLSSLDNVLLMGPGPSPVAANTIQALTAPMLGHMDPQFIDLMDALQQQIRAAMNTKNRATLTISASGMSGMETACVNLIEPGCKVLIPQNGVFAQRMIDVASRLGAEVTELKFEWGKAVDPDVVEAAMKKQHYDIVAMIHADTSTGVRNPVEAIGALTQKYGALLLVDCVTSLGGIEVAIDRWHVDLAYSGSQKCLSCPPGLAPLSLSDAAEAHIRQRKTKVPNWYLDLPMLISYWEGAKRFYHHTAPICMYYALHQALDNFLTEGQAHAFARHLENHKRLLAGMARFGFEPFVAEDVRLPMVNVLKVPAGLDEAALRGRLRREHKIEIGGGLGPLSGKVVRIGCMGEGARPEPVDRLIAAVEACLK